MTDWWANGSITRIPPRQAPSDPDTMWVMSPDYPKLGQNQAGFEIPTGEAAEFIRDELRVDPKFFCAYDSKHYTLIKQARDGLVLLEKLPWPDGVFEEFDRIQGGWDVAEVVGEDEEPECRHLSWDWTLQTCVDCGEPVDMPKIPEPTGGCTADRWGRGAHRFLGNYCIACGFRRTV